MRIFYLKLFVLIVCAAVVLPAAGRAYARDEHETLDHKSIPKFGTVAPPAAKLDAKTAYKKINMHEIRGEPDDWENADKEMPEDWLKKEIEPNLSYYINSIKKIGDDESIVDYRLQIPVSDKNIKNSTKKVFGLFQKQFIAKFPFAENIELQIVFPDADTILDSCRYLKKNYWELETTVEYQTTKLFAPVVESYRVYGLVSEGLPDHQLYIKEWSDHKINFCTDGRNSAPVVITRADLQSWMQRVDFSIFEDNPNFSAEGALSFQEAHGLLENSTKTFHIQSVGQISINKECSFYGENYWDVSVPVTYSENSKQHESIIHAGIHQRAYGTANDDSVQIDRWSIKPEDYCGQVRARTYSAENAPLTALQAQTWIKENLPQNIEFMLQHEDLFISKTTLHSIKDSAHFISNIGLAAKNNGYDWKSSAQGQVVLENNPLFIASCKKAQKNSLWPDQETYYWEMEWPSVFTLTSDNQPIEKKYTYWITLEHKTIEGKTPKIRISWFDLKPQHICLE